MTVLAAIDIGSISVRLLVARYQDRKLISMTEALEITRLGQGVGETGILNEERINHTLSVLENFQRMADECKAERIFAVGTSAIRDADNGSSFADRIKVKTRIEMQILSGEEEARLTFGGAYNDLGFSDTIMLIDVGGGSTEIICGDEQDIITSVSIDAGAVRMTEKYLKQDPVALDEYHVMLKAITHMIRSSGAGSAVRQCKHLVGVGGTVTSLAAIALGLEEYDSGLVHLYRLTRKKLNSILEQMIIMNDSERKEMIGLQPERSDIIIAGAVIVQQAMAEFGWHEIIVSENDILQGVLLNYMGVITDGPFFKTR
jgi:exopolyphosphatase / guanosine-5'-triphosphate,3'-diphosphate pyrophosphatase